MVITENCSQFRQSSIKFGLLFYKNKLKYDHVAWSNHKCELYVHEAALAEMMQACRVKIDLNTVTSRSAWHDLHTVMSGSAWHDPHTDIHVRMARPAQKEVQVREAVPTHSDVHVCAIRPTHS